MDGHREGFLERVEAFLKRHGEQEAFPEAPEGTETWQVRFVAHPVEPNRWRVLDANGKRKDGAEASMRIKVEDRNGRKTRDPAAPGYTMRVFVEDVIHATCIHCDACRLAGWSHHPVCAKRVHFVMGVEEKGNVHPIARTRKLCTACGRTIAVSSRTCPLCRSDTRNHAYLTCTTHLLHGMVHGNGCGHLLRINGRQGGSMALSGKQLMVLWDDLCHDLGARKISVEDVSNWHGMEFRMLHLAAHGSTWYGRFGYKWARGSYNHTEDEWKRCTKTVQHFPLKHILEDLHATGMKESDLAHTILHYGDLTKATTVGALLRGMLECFRKAAADERDRGILPACGPRSGSPLCNGIPTLCRVMSGKTSTGSGRDPVAPVPTTSRWQDQETPLAEERRRARNGKRPSKGKRGRTRIAQGRTPSCRWVPARVSRAQQAVVEVLKDRKGGPISRQDLRDLVRLHIGDTGLLDHVLKTVGECTVGKYKVRRAADSQSGVMQYSLVAAQRQNHEDIQTDAAGGSADARLVGEKRKAGHLVFSEHNGASHPATTEQKTTNPPSSSRDAINAVLLVYHQVLLEYKPANVRRHGSKRSKGLKGQDFQECCQVLLDTKHFVKVYEGDALPPHPGGDTIRVRCSAHVVDMPPSLQPAPRRRRRPPAPQPPPEVVSMPASGTFGDLKRRAQSTFATIYPIFQAWQVKEVDGLRHVANRTRVSTVLRDGATVMLRGTGVAVDSTWRFETGLDHWVVRCSCGTTDDDGERMLECERCGTWLHTRCLGITDAQAIPACFVCPDCGPSDRSA